VWSGRGKRRVGWGVLRHCKSKGDEYSELVYLAAIWPASTNLVLVGLASASGVVPLAATTILVLDAPTPDDLIFALALGAQLAG